MEEILNIQYHVERMVVKALNSFDKSTAAQKLGITKRTLFRYISNLNIVRDEKGQYFIKEQKAIA